MDESVGTVFFDGQFWVFIIERSIRDEGLMIGKYTFGAEPTNTDLLAFYLRVLPFLPVYQSDVRIRVKAKKRMREQERITTKAKDAYKDLRAKDLLARKGERKIAERNGEKERYLLKRLKTKERHRGH